MAKLINLNSPKVADTKRLIKTHGTQTPLSSTSVERGKTHWLNGSEVHIDGILGIDGTATVTGTLNASGDINLSGTTEITGPLDITGATTIGGSLDVTGPTRLDGKLDIGGDTTITGMLDVTGPIALDGKVTINGDTSVTGALDVTGPTAIKGTLGIEGVSTLKNDLNVTAGGKIKAGNVEIEPANGGQVNFTGGSLSAGQFGALLNNTTAVELQAPTVKLNTGNVNINSLPTKPASELTPVGIDSAGRLHRIA